MSRIEVRPFGFKAERQRRYLMKTRISCLGKKQKKINFIKVRFEEWKKNSSKGAGNEK
jgi:hypothetical protein